MISFITNNSIKEVQIKPITWSLIYATFTVICVFSGFCSFALLSFVIFPFMCNMSVKTDSHIEMSNGCKTTDNSANDSVLTSNSKIEKKSYSISELYLLKPSVQQQSSYKVVPSRNHTVNHSTKQVKHSFSHGMNENHSRSSSSINIQWKKDSSRSASPSLSIGSTESSPYSSRNCTPRPYENTDDNEHDVYRYKPSSLPSDPITGKVQWIHNNNGRIRANMRIGGVRDIFFHFNDVVNNNNNNKNIHVGQNCQFIVSLYQKRLCATHIAMETL